jgi:hypothetical protein
MHRTIVTGLLIAAVATPAAAQDTAEKVGIAAALGLTAGTGKTTLGDDAGSIEAALLNTDAMDQAGRIIAGVVRGKTAGKVLVVGRTDSVDLITGPFLRRRMTGLTTALGAVKECPKNVVTGKSALTKFLEGTTDTPSSTKTKFQLSDITAALATDVKIATVKVPVEDRMLIQSIALNRRTGPITRPAIDWSVISPPATVADVGDFVVPAELTASVGSKTLTTYESLLHAADAKRRFPCDEAKALVSAADAYVASINAAPGGGGATPLGQAVQAEAFGNEPQILRVVAEQAGGTSIVSANIWYTLGFPGAATVSAGLIASFRLVNPRTGATTVAGVVRCASTPINVKHARTIVADPIGTRTQCAYRTSG